MKKILLAVACCAMTLLAQANPAHKVKINDGLTVSVEACSESIFRIKVSPRKDFTESLMERYELIKTDWSDVKTDISDKGGVWTLKTSEYSLAINKKTGVMTVKDAKGGKVIREVRFLPEKEGLCGEMRSFINEKYADLKVADNGGGIIGDDNGKFGEVDKHEIPAADAVSILSAVVVEQVVVGAQLLVDLGHVLLNNSRQSVVNAVAGLAVLEEHVAVLVGTAHLGAFGVQSLLAELLNSLHVAHFLQISVVPLLDLLVLVRGTEAIEEVQEGNLALDGCQMGDRGQILSCDVHPYKVKLIESGAKRLGLTCIRTTTADARENHAAWRQQADVVMADVPCSGLGIIRKKPDIRYKSPKELAQLPLIQRAILENAASYVRPGGTLVYSTCTVLPEENEDVTGDFLDQHPEFEPVRTVFPLPVGPCPGQVTLWPQRHGTDGFYICRMRRKD